LTFACGSLFLVPSEKILWVADDAIGFGGGDDDEYDEYDDADGERTIEGLPRLLLDEI
jgi:hypothetical protein